MTHNRPIKSTSPEIADTSGGLAPPINSKPRIPPSPVLSLGTFFGLSDNRSNLLDTGNHLLLTSGRMAIALALELAKIQTGDEVLVPAYHCSSMVAPIANTGASPVFYKISADMHVDLEHIQSLLTQNTKALLVTHYFGFAQHLPELRSFCDTYKLLLIEDCAHSFFGEVDGQPIGSYGDYAIGSLMKFFPVFDGGCLVSSHHDLSSARLESGGKGFELQTTLNAIELSFKYNRLKLISALMWIPLSIKTHLWSMIKRRRSGLKQYTPATPTASQGGFDFDPTWIHKTMSVSSKFIFKHASTEKIIRNRLNNYTYLSKQLYKCASYEPLHPSLPMNTVPYAFPLLVTGKLVEIDRIFYSLRQKGVPLMRWELLWEGVDSGVCETSLQYSRRLIQIPCHQAFKRSELEWMAHEIQLAFSSTTGVC